MRAMRTRGRSSRLPRPPRPTALLVAGLAAVTITAAGGCGGGSGGHGGDGGGASGGGPGKAINEPASVGTLLEVCASGSHLPGSPAYAGPAPHPIRIYAPDPGAAGESTAPRPVLINQPAAATGGINGTAEQTQLVACVERTGSTPTDVRCQYVLKKDVPLHRATYRLVLREARSGATVSTIDLGPAAQGCPGTAKLQLAGQGDVYTLPSDVQYLEALRRYTEWNGQPPRPTTPTGQEVGGPAGGGAAAGSGATLTEGLVTLTMPAGADEAVTAALKDYLAFWDGYTRAYSTPDPADPVLRAHADPQLAIQVASSVNLSMVQPRRAIRGPVTLSPTVRSPTATAVTIDDCFDGTRQQYFEEGQATGETGTRSAQTVTMAPRAGGWAVQSLAAGPVDQCG